MIVPSYTDEMTLRELMDDWPSVKRAAKKLSKKLLEKLPKGRIGVPSAGFYGRSGTFITKNCNRWHVSVHCRPNSTMWYSTCFAEVESKFGTRTCIYLRGMNTEKPYYIEIIPHAIKRIRERYVLGNGEAYYAEKSTDNICEGIFQERHTCGVFLAAGKVGRDGHFHAFTDGEGNTPGVAQLRYFTFYGRRTPAGNFLLKTFILNDAEPGSRKEEFLNMLFGLYAVYNPGEFGAKGKDFKEHISKKFFKMLYEKHPHMHRHLDCIDERLVLMRP